MPWRDISTNNDGTAFSVGFARLRLDPHHNKFLLKSDYLPGDDERILNTDDSETAMRLAKEMLLSAVRRRIEMIEVI